MRAFAAFSFRVDEVAIKDSVSLILSKYIQSVTELETLLLLKRYSDRQWLAKEVAREMYTDPFTVEQYLQTFEKDGFLTSRVDEQTRYVFYQFNPNTEELKPGVTDLAIAYAEARVRVIDLIFSKPLDNIKSFSDAFKIVKDEPE